MDAPSKNLAFRSAGLDDVEALIALVESAYRGEASRVGWTTEADLLDGQRIDRAMLTELLAESGTRVLLVEADAQLTACCELRHEGAAAYFGMFAVRPDCQGRGIGDRVLAEAERRVASEWGCREMRMTVIEQRAELIAWYQRRGYQRTGIFKPFPYGDARFGLPRRPDLRFEVLSKPLA